MTRINQYRGLTLIELVVAIAIVAILLTLGVPSLQQTIKNNRVAAQNNELVAMLSFAKSHAVRSNQTVTTQLTASGSDWSGVVLDPDGSGAEPCISQGALRCADNTSVALSTDAAEIGFDNRGYLELDGEWEAVTIYLQHEGCSGPRQRRRIDILPTGQISSCGLACDATTECP